MTQKTAFYNLKDRLYRTPKPPFEARNTAFHGLFCVTELHIHTQIRIKLLVIKYLIMHTFQAIFTSVSILF